MKRYAFLIGAVVSLTAAQGATAAPDAEIHSETTDTAGTTVTTDATASDSVTATGRTKTTVDAERSIDPKGLGNKTTEEYHARANIDKDGAGNERVKSIDSAGTSRTTDQTTKIDRGHDGSSTVTTNRTDTVDPKGLMNKKTTKSTTTVTRKADGTVTTSREIDGAALPEEHAISR